LSRGLNLRWGTSGRFTSFILEPIIKKLQRKRRNLGPAELLTLPYSHQRLPSRSLTDLLAARSLIYIKLLNEGELLPGATLASHAEDDIRVNNVLDQLRFEDYEKLFKSIRLVNRELSLQTVEEYFISKKAMI
jgi:hypothetical protein